MSTKQHNVLTGADLHEPKAHTHDDRYYTETELDAGQLDARYYTETESDARYQLLDADLTAIAALGFVSISFLKKTAANTWALDTATYLPLAGGTLTGALTVNAHSAFGIGASVDQQIDGTDSFQVINLRETLTSNLGINNYGLFSLITAAPTANTAGGFYGTGFIAQSAAGNTFNIAEISGIIGSAYHKGSGTIDVLSGFSGSAANESTGIVTDAVGMKAYTNQGGIGGTINTAIGLDAQVLQGAAGMIGTSYGVLIRSASNSGAGTWTNNYGIYIQDQSAVGSTNSYNLYSAGATSKIKTEGSLEALSFIIGANTLTTSEWAILDGITANKTIDHTAVTISTTAPLTGGGDISANRTFAIPAATTSVNGYLTSTDWTTFNSKQAGHANLTSLAGLSYVSLSFVKMSAAGTFSLDTSTYLTGNQTITLSGDVSGSGTTAITTAIGSGKVTLAMMANMATASLLGRNTAGAGVPEVITDIPTAVTIGGAYIYRVGGTDVAATDGGTGLSIYAVGDLLYAPTTTTIGKLADVATGSYLASGGVGVAPAWATLNQAVVAGLTATSSPTFYNLTLNNGAGTSVLTILGLEGVKLQSATSPYIGFYSAVATRIGYAGYGLGIVNLEIVNSVSGGNINLDTNAGTINLKDNVVLTAGNDIRPSADSTTAINFANAAGTDQVIFDTTNSRVGIGGVTPLDKLHIRAGVGAGIRLFTNYPAESESNTTLNVIDFYKHVDAGPSASIRIYNKATFAEHSYAGSDLRFAMGSAFTDRVVIKSDGKVGIGTMFPAPTTLLDVAGIGLFADRTSLGTEKALNPNFTTVPDTNWTWGTGWTHDTTNFEADHAAAGGVAALEQNVSAVAGEVYLLTFTIVNNTASPHLSYVVPQVGGVNAAGASANAIHTRTIIATGTGNLKFTPLTGFNGSIDTVSLKKITGGNLVVLGNEGIGLANPTARLHIAAGTATASTAPLKLTTGVSLTTAELGAMEFTDPNLYFTITDTTVKRKGIIMDDGTTLVTGRVPYTTTNGRLLSSANLLFDGTSIQAAGYKSSDGTIGYTGTLNDSTSTAIAEIKNGLIVSVNY